jgi:hypothetical protein
VPAREVSGDGLSEDESFAGDRVGIEAVVSEARS